MARSLDMDKIARGLGAARKGPISAKGGYVGALDVLADISARFRTPSSGGRSTDPRWTERRLLPLAALLLEKTTAELSDDDAESVVRRRQAGRRRGISSPRR